MRSVRRSNLPAGEVATLDRAETYRSVRSQMRSMLAAEPNRVGRDRANRYATDLMVKGTIEWEDYARLSHELALDRW